MAKQLRLIITFSRFLFRFVCDEIIFVRKKSQTKNFLRLTITISWILSVFFFEKYGWEWDWLWIFPRYICLHQKKVNQCVHAGCIGDDVEQALVIDAVGFGNILIKVKNCWVVKMLLIGFEDIVSYQRKSCGFEISQAWGWKLVEFHDSKGCQNYCLPPN
jgi:hypothetical protein